MYVVAWARAMADGDRLAQPRPKIPVWAEERVELEQKWDDFPDRSLPDEHLARLAADVQHRLQSLLVAVTAKISVLKVSILKLLARTRPGCRALWRSGPWLPQVQPAVRAIREQAALQAECEWLLSLQLSPCETRKSRPRARLACYLLQSALYLRLALRHDDPADDHSRIPESPVKIRRSR